MLLFINLVYLLIFIYLFCKYLQKDEVIVKLRINDEKVIVGCTGQEYVIILLITTGIMGLIPVLALHLAIAELVCIMLIRSAPNTPVYSLPIKMFFVFIIWTVVGLIYSPSVEYGVRMILKYLYPPLIALAASAIVDDIYIFLKAGNRARLMAVLSFLAYYLPMQGFIFMGVFWNRAALATNYITWVVYSFALYTIGLNKKKNLIYGFLFILPCLIWVFRTNIFGTSVALAAFFFVKYRLRSLPLVAAMAALAISALFFLPAVKSKMYYKPNEVTIEDFISGNVDENNVRTNGRNEMWEKVTPFYEEHKLAGSGTGRVQKYFYTEILGFGRGGQLHNELLLILCDNGLIGLFLFLSSYVAILLHCVKLYRRTINEWTKACALTAGASLFGILVTLYSDNTVSYSLATLGIPWAFYGMALGIYRKEQENNL